MKPLSIVKGVDCFSTISPGWAPQLRALGYDFAARYYRKAPLTGGKGNAVSKEEVAALHASGLAFLPVYQNTSDKVSYFTEENAEADTEAALAAAQFHGQPKGTVIYFAVDTNPAESEMPLIENYFAHVVCGVEHAGWGVGVYGSGLVCSRLKRGYVERTWLSNAKGWRGYREWLPHADVVQTTLPFTLPFGLQVDGNEARNDAGMWKPTKHEPYEPAETGFWGAIRTAVRLIMGQRS